MKLWKGELKMSKVIEKINITFYEIPAYDGIIDLMKVGHVGGSLEWSTNKSLSVGCKLKILELMADNIRQGEDKRSDVC